MFYQITDCFLRALLEVDVTTTGVVVLIVTGACVGGWMYVGQLASLQQASVLDWRKVQLAGKYGYRGHLS